MEAGDVTVGQLEKALQKDVISMKQVRGDIYEVSIGPRGCAKPDEFIGNWDLCIGWVIGWLAERGRISLD